MLLCNRYQVLQSLGEGGFGKTFLAEDIQIPFRPKRVVKQLVMNDKNPIILEHFKTRFQQEAVIETGELKWRDRVG